jgi:hypothetical protein
MAMLQGPKPATGTSSASPKNKNFTGIMHRSYEVYDGPMDRPYEIDHILAAEYVGREDALRYVLAKIEERRLLMLEDQGKLDPKQYPDIVDDIEAARAAAADELARAESEYSSAKDAKKRLRQHRGTALRSREVMKLTKAERELSRDALAAREGIRDDNDRLVEFGWENHQNNINYANEQGQPLSEDNLQRHEEAIARLKQKETDLLAQLEGVRQARRSTVVEVDGKPITLGELEDKLEDAETMLDSRTERRDKALSRVHSVGKVGAAVTRRTMVGYFLAAYEKRLSTMDARALLAEYRDKIERYPGLMPEWANWMAEDFAGMYYYKGNTTWHDAKALLLALVEQNAMPIDREIEDIEAQKPRKGQLPPHLAARLAELEAERNMIRAIEGPQVSIGDGQKSVRVSYPTPWLIRSQVEGIDEKQRLGLLNHFWKRGQIPLDAWRYIVTKTQLRLNDKVITDLMKRDQTLLEAARSASPGNGRVSLVTYYKLLIDTTRDSPAYIKTITDPFWQGILNQWRHVEFNAWRRRGWAEVKENVGAYRTSVVQKNNVCNETAETAQMRRGQILPGGLWKNVKYYADNHHFKRVTNEKQLLSGASLFNLEWMDRLKSGDTNGARYHPKIRYLTEGKKVIFPRGPNSGRVIGDWQYDARTNDVSIARTIPFSGPRPLASGVSDPDEPHAEGRVAGDTQYLQWKHQATVVHRPWDLSKRTALLTWETRHGGDVPEHLGFRARNVSDIVGSWKFWIGWTNDDVLAAKQTEKAHQAALAAATEAGLPEVEPGLMTGEDPAGGLDQDAE